jgi:hypothetical protein
MALPEISGDSLQFKIDFPKEDSNGLVEGRVLLLLSKHNEKEPRFQISDSSSTGFVFGVDVIGKQSSKFVTIDWKIFGYPISSLNDIPKGDYWIQGLFHKYETFNLKTGHKLKLPMDRGEGQHWYSAPGNLYSKPEKINLDPNKAMTKSIFLDRVIPSIEPPKDTDYIKHIKIQSKLLTEFWGRPMHLGAHVLLPHGFQDHPDAKYPLMIFHGHYPEYFGGFRP